MGVDLPYKLSAIAELTGHEDRAWNVAWNPVKPLLATCSADKTVRLYGYSGIPTPTFSFHTSISTDHGKTVRSIAWSPSGETLATASFDSTIGIWQQKGAQDEDEEVTAGEWQCASLLEGHETECKSVAWSASGTLLASCSRDKTVWVWEVQPDCDFECLGVLMEHTQDVKSVAWHPSEEILASASYDDTIKLYLDDPSDDWFCFETLKGHTSTVWSLAWAPGGRYLASASDDCTVRIWKRVAEHQWECVCVLEGHERTIYSVSWGMTTTKRVSEEGGEPLGWLASAGGDGRINIWQLEEAPNSTVNSPPKYELISCIENGHGDSDINSIVWCPRAGYQDLLATVGDDGMAKVWKIEVA
ncbi:WD40 repeat-like protein [Artomyces pyxidatus]|uniref:WD40 repeat-like protein n=1 Tax=Artomyces pyxidatus TaxID=48021 RepID=A0ACB8T8R8_9AGAM|nr:WD40 repeat-like protein [Artomyces pyxidatus]